MIQIFSALLLLVCNSAIKRETFQFSYFFPAHCVLLFSQFIFFFVKFCVKIFSCLLLCEHFFLVRTFCLIVHKNFTLSTCLVHLEILKFLLKSKGSPNTNFHFFYALKPFRVTFVTKKKELYLLKKNLHLSRPLDATFSSS